ncbi:MAG: F0F1 ATP synthase subunit A [Alphaproteobacteria bacterium]
MDPLHQFEIKSILPFKVWDITLTNSAFAMLLTVFIIFLFFYKATKKQYMIPNRLQAFMEYVFDAIYSIVETHIGEKGIIFFPYVLSLFVFILTGNLLGIFPYCFTFTSHIIVTFTLAFIVFIFSLVVDIVHNKIAFVRRFCPSNVPLILGILFIPIEFISYLSRPVSLSVRLFANMVAGHIMLKIFSSFAVSFVTHNYLFPLSLIPLSLNIVIMAFEIFIALLQAYVFTVLTCIYIKDAFNTH